MRLLLATRPAPQLAAFLFICLARTAPIAAQQVDLPQDIFGQVAAGADTRLSSRIGTEWSGSIEALVGTHRAFRSWYRPSAVGFGVTRLFAGGCQVQTLGECVRTNDKIPWLTVMTGATRRGPYGELRIMAGLGVAYAKGQLGSSSGLTPAFESRLDYLPFGAHTRPVAFLRYLGVSDRAVSQANGVAIGIGIAQR